MSSRSYLKRSNCFFCERKFSYDWFGGFHSSELITKTLDHIIPESKGGLNSKINTLVCCGHCNSSKSALSIDEFIEKIKYLISTGGEFKNIPGELLPKMLKKAEELKGYIERKGDRLYKAKSIQV